MTERDDKGNVTWSDGSDWDVYGETAQQKADRVKSSQLEHSLDNVKKVNGIESKEYADAKQTLDTHYQDMYNRNMTQEATHLGMNDYSRAQAAYKYEQDQAEEKAREAAYKQRKANYRSGNWWKNQLMSAVPKLLTGDVAGALGQFSSAKVMPSGWNDASERMSQIATANKKANSLGLGILNNGRGSNSNVNFTGNIGNKDINRNITGMFDKMHQNKLERASNKQLKQMQPIETMQYEEFIPTGAGNMRQSLAGSRTNMPFVGNKADLRNSIKNLNSTFTNQMQPGTVGSNIGNGPQGDVNRFKIGTDVSNKQPRTFEEAMKAWREGNVNNVNKKEQLGQTVRQQQNMQQAMHPDRKTLNSTIDRNRMLQAGERINAIQGADDTNMSYNMNNVYQDAYDKAIANGATPEQAKLAGKINVATTAATELTLPISAASIAKAGIDIGAQQGAQQILNQIANGGFKGTIDLFGKKMTASGAKKVVNTLAKRYGVEATKQLVAAGLITGAAGASNVYANSITDGNKVTSTTYTPDSVNPYAGETYDTTDLLSGVNEYSRPSEATSRSVVTENTVPAESVNNNYETEEPTIGESNNNDSSNFDQETSDRNMDEMSQEEREEAQRQEAYYQRVADYIQKMYGIDITSELPEGEYDTMKNGYVANSKFDGNLNYLIADELQNDEDVQEFNQELTQEEFEDFIKANPWVADMIVNKFGQQ